MPVWRRYAKLRTQLYPYLAAADDEYQRTGLPIMRHLALAYPDDPRATAREDEFLFGPDLLAAPVIEPGATRRALYLPRGNWVDLWRSVDYVDRDGSLRAAAARARCAGGRDHDRARAARRAAAARARRHDPAAAAAGRRHAVGLRRQTTSST